MSCAYFSTPMEVSDSCLYITYISESPLRPAPPYFKPAQKSWSASAAQLWQRIIEQWLHCQPCLTMPDGSLPVGFQVWGYLGIGSRVWGLEYSSRDSQRDPRKDCTVNSSTNKPRFRGLSHPGTQGAYCSGFCFKACLLPVLGSDLEDKLDSL